MAGRTRARIPARRYIYGHSLGGAVAIDLAAKSPATPSGAHGLIVESTFTSLPSYCRK
jgi:alpha-beta hydrolase superfamily lysophospholipase